MPKQRHIGGSLLPSNDPEILTPVKVGNHTLEVRALPKLDTHKLFFDDEELAEHPNGFSCKALANRIIAGDLSRVSDQANYIKACGGKIDLPAIKRVVALLK